MPPRLLQLVTGALIAVSALVACRREVPPPPVPDEMPKPKVDSAHYVALTASALRRQH